MLLEFATWEVSPAATCHAWVFGKAILILRNSDSLGGGEDGVTLCFAPRVDFLLAPMLE